MKAIAIYLGAFVAFAAVSGAYSRADLGNEHGSGGDELRFVFEEGRQDAVQKISALRRCSFDSSVSEAVKDWILGQRMALIADIAQSAHSWITDEQPTCAFTQTKSAFPITLSFVACKNIASKEQAGRLLTHETVHHFGIADEAFADSVALAVYNASFVATCPDPSEDPFDPSSCVGDPMTSQQRLKYFEPGSTESKQVGALSFAVRTRTCTAETGCGAWTTSPDFVDFGVIHKVYGGCNGECMGHTSMSDSESHGRNLSGFQFTVGSAVRLNLHKQYQSGYPSYHTTSYLFAGIFNDDHGQLEIGNDSLRYSNSWERTYLYLLRKGQGGASVNKSGIRTNLSGKFTDHCLRLSGRTRQDNSQDRRQWFENEVVVYSRY
jgi:hypothetical protein